MKRTLTIAVGLLCALMGVSAANVLPEEPADTSRIVDLDEVVVVAQPKEQVRLRLQPMSSTIFTGDEMQKLNIRDLSTVSAYVPSFAMPAYGSRLTSSMYIRGLGSRVSNSAVGVYYDNIPVMSKSAYNTHLYSIDRIDVLRGPQGTLYGANTEGGLVRVYSKNPMNYQGADILLGVATAFGRRAEVSVSRHPSDRLAFSVAAFYNGQNGFFENQNLNEKSDKMNEGGGKLRVMWKPAQRLLIDLTTDYQYTRQNGFPYGDYDPDEQWTALPSTTFMPAYKRNMVNTGLNVSYDMDKLLLTSTTSYQFLRDRMDMDIDYTAADGMALIQRQKTSAVTEELSLRSKNSGLWHHATGIFGSRQWLKTDATVSFGQSIMCPIGLAIETAMKSSMLHAFTGRYIAQGMTPAAAAAAAQAQVDAMGVTMKAEMAVPSSFRQPQTILAAYHESNLKLTDRLTATLGLRLDYNKVEIDYDSYGYMAMTGGTASAIATNTLSSHLLNSHSTSFTQLLPKMGLSYNIDHRGSNVYLSVSKGYMAGGYNIQLFSDILQADLNDPDARQQAQRGDVAIEHTGQDYANIEEAISYKPEESWNFEAGTHLNLFDHKLQADVATFYNRLLCQQLSVMAPNFGFGRMTVNAGKSTTCGLEASLRGLASERHLSWAASYSFTRATFKEYKEEEAANGTVTLHDYKDNKIPYVPAHTLSATADYRFDLSASGLLRSLSIGANVVANGRTYWDDANTAWQDLYAVVGAHVLADMGTVSVDVWGRNLTDTKYCTFAQPFNGAYIGQRGNPLQVGMDVRITIK